MLLISGGRSARVVLQQLSKKLALTGGWVDGCLGGCESGALICAGGGALVCCAGKALVCCAGSFAAVAWAEPWLPRDATLSQV